MLLGWPLYARMKAGHSVEGTHCGTCAPSPAADYPSCSAEVLLFCGSVHGVCMVVR
jgi:hypothetical protein